jgi:hypothetical protein
MQIRDARKDLMDDGLGYHGKCQDVLGVIPYTRISNRGKCRDREEIGERKGYEGHPKSLHRLGRIVLMA